MGSGSGTWYTINVPSGFNASSTSIYGVDNVGSDNVDLVGSYVSSSYYTGTTEYPRIGFYYDGPLLLQVLTVLGSNLIKLKTPSLNA